MEDVSAMPMHVNALQVLAIKIATQVRPFVNHQALFTLQGCQMSKHTAKETYTNNEKIIFLSTQSHNIRKGGEGVR